MAGREDGSARWRENPIFAAAGDATCAELARLYPAKRVAAGTTIFGAGAPADHLHVLLSGTVRIFHETADGRQVTVKLLRAPNLFGEIELLHDLALLEHVGAVDEVELARIPAEDYRQFLLRHPRATYEHLKHLAAAFCIAARGERHVFAPIKARIANLLLSYAEFFAVEESGRTLIAHPLSQQSIALSLGAVRRSVAETLAEWIKRGWIEKRREHYVILEHEPLRQLAEPIRDSLCYQIGMPLDHLPGEHRLSEATLQLLSGPGSHAGRRYPVGDSVVVGTKAPSVVVVADERVSEQHCRVFRGSTGSRYWVEDLQSLNGTFLNGRPVRRAVLRDGDRIRVGGIEIGFEERPVP